MKHMPSSKNKSTYFFFPFLFFLFLSSINLLTNPLFSQTTETVCVSHSGTCGCTSGCCTSGGGSCSNNPNGTCSPQATGNCSRDEVTRNLNVPPNTDLSIDTETERCGQAITLGPGLDSGDDLFVNGVIVVNGSGNLDAVYSGCFSNTSNTQTLTVEVRLNTNRKDECINLTYNTTANGGVPGPGCTVLASSVLKFTTSLLSNNQVALNWQTNSGIAFSTFRIERSGDGLQFNEIGTVVNPHQINQNEASFKFLDETPKTGLNYYRIVVEQSVDEQAISEVRVILTEFNEVRINNPVKNSIMLNMPSKINVEGITIFNLLGQKIKSFDQNTLFYSEFLDVKELDPGYYILSLQSNIGMVNKQFLKL